MSRIRGGFRGGLRSVALCAAGVLLTASCSDSSDAASDAASGDASDGPSGAGRVTAVATVKPSPRGSAYTSVTLRPQAAATDEQLLQAATIIRSRLASGGVRDTEVQVYQGQIVVTAYGKGNQLPADIAATAFLTFRPVLAAETQPAATGSGTPRNSRPRATPPPIDFGNPDPGAGGPAQSADLSAYGVTPELTAQYQALDCAATQAQATRLDPSKPAAVCAFEAQDGTTEKYMLGPAVIDGTDVESAAAQLPGQGQAGGWEVAMRFDGAGTAKFTSVTGDLAAGQYPTNRFAVVLDDRVRVAPTVSTELPGGEAVITGDFSEKEAKALAAALRFGALPMGFTIVERTTVPAP